MSKEVKKVLRYASNYNILVLIAVNLCSHFVGTGACPGVPQDFPKTRHRKEMFRPKIPLYEGILHQYSMTRVILEGALYSNPLSSDQYFPLMLWMRLKNSKIVAHSGNRFCCQISGFKSTAAWPSHPWDVAIIYLHKIVL